MRGLGGTPQARLGFGVHPTDFSSIWRIIRQIAPFHNEKPPRRLRTYNDPIRFVPLMSTYPNTKMVKYTHDWVYFDACTAEMVFCARTHMADLGDGMDYTATNWTRLKYAGDGRFSLEEDIYNPANFIALIQRWEAAAQQAKP
jgi:hypothetical protein